MNFEFDSMNQLQLESTHLSPRIYFDLPRGVIKITGRAVDTPTDEKFEMLVSWVELYCRVPNQTTRVDVELELVSDYSLKYISQILWLLNNLHGKGKTRLTVFWFIDAAHEQLVKQIERVEEKVGMKIYKLSPLLT